MDEITMIENFFKSSSLQIIFSRFWLESCVQWCKEENLPATYSPKDLLRKVFDQWMLLDLRDVEVPSLPPGLSTKIKFTLTGNYSLQMMQVVDISKPKYWQIQKIRNGLPKNVDQEAESSKRVLMLTLTDGVQQVEATELRFIQCLNLNLSPGIKIKLMGPIDIRRGRLLLEDRHVQVIGGEVEDLAVENAAENVLAKHLKLPLNPSPSVIQESLMTANTDMFRDTGVANAVRQGDDNRNQSNHQPSSKLEANSTISNSMIDLSRSNQLPQSTESRRVYNSTIQSTRDNNDYFELEEDRLNEEIDILMEVERDFEEERVKRRKPNKSPDIFDNKEFDNSDFENLVIPDSVITTVRTESAGSLVPKNDPKLTTSKNNETEIVDLSDSLELDNDVFENLDIDAHLDKIDKELNISQPIIWTIEKLVQNIPNINNGKFKIKAKFKSIVEKMIVIDDKFHLVIKVEDATGDISLRVHDDIVADFIGFSAVDLMKLKSEVMENNSEAQGKILGALKGLKEKLIELDKIAEVHVNVKEKYPVVLKLL